MKIKSTRIYSSVLLIACLLLSNPGEVKPQDKPADAGETDKIYKPSELDEKPVVDKRSRDESVPSAPGCKGQGTVLLRAVMRKSGKVTDVKIIEKSKCSVFDERAIRATQKTKFKPAKKDGVGVSTYMTFEYNYAVW
jgi:TonB family protein